MANRIKEKKSSQMSPSRASLCSTEESSVDIKGKEKWCLVAKPQLPIAGLCVACCVSEDFVSTSKLVRSARAASIPQKERAARLVTSEGRSSSYSTTLHLKPSIRSSYSCSVPKKKNLFFK